MWKVFIDGSSGTTGLRIRQRLAEDPEIELLNIPYEQRHDPFIRADAIARSDCTFLCLPDQAAREIADLTADVDTVIIDTSTAHRTAEGWTYGLPELAGQKEKIKSSKRIANPGCHATGMILLTAPLVRKGILPADADVSCTSLTGYTGGGKKMIAQYEAADRDPLLYAPRLYGLNAAHKHLSEMVKYSGLAKAPGFAPVVADYDCGMETIIMLDASQLNGMPDQIAELYEKEYSGPVVRWQKSMDENGFVSACAMKGRDDLTVTVCGNKERIFLLARFDNLGKGASGAAIQNMNLALHRNETDGLILGE